MRAFSVSIAVEGPSDERVITRIVNDHDIAVGAVYGLRGKDHLDKRLGAFNEGAKHGKWLVVRDLDHDADCAATLVRRLLPQPHAGMRYRVAVRALEAWLLADAEGVAAFFGVARHHVPHDPEGLEDPKMSLVQLARRSRVRAIRDDMVPSEDTTARVGPGFVGRIIDFASTKWSWRRGATRSDSLRRCVERIAAWR